MRVQRVALEKYTSNVFILEKEGEDFVWLVDIGEFEPVVKSLPASKWIKGVFLTHPHYDHMEGIQKLVEAFPGCLIAGSGETLGALKNAKENLSFYHEHPIEFSRSEQELELVEGSMEIFPGIQMEIIATPGHYSGSFTFYTAGYWFTGDSLVPGHPVVTKLKGGDKNINQITLKNLFKKFEPEHWICPGHGKMIQASELVQTDYILR
ncbi:hypothetical protein MASR2M44_14220 [Bacteroidota bacterium]